jgi:hypothetical protein
MKMTRSTTNPDLSTGECDACHRELDRWRGEPDISCPCGAEYNCFGQRLRDDWRSNPSNYSDEIGDLEGFEMSQLAKEQED